MQLIKLIVARKVNYIGLNNITTSTILSYNFYIYNIYFVHLIKKYSFSNKYSTIINNSNSCNIHH